MAQPGTVIASRACHDCGERCQIKLNKNYIAYYFCPSCRSSHRFNREVSAELDAKFERMNRTIKHEPANDNEIGKVRATDGSGTAEPESPAEGPVASDDKPEATSERQSANDNGKPSATGGHGRRTDTGDYFDEIYG